MSLTYQRVFRKLARIGLHYPQRSFQMMAYAHRLLTKKAFPESELTLRQKWKSDYILPGSRSVRAPRNYIKPTANRLGVIDDVLPLSPFFWKQHNSTRLPLPKTATGQPVIMEPWYSPEASFILKVTDGFIAPDGLVFDKQSVYRNARWFYQPPPDGLAVEQYNRLLTLVQLWGHRFIHFTFDTLPRIDLAFDFLKDNPDVRILVPEADFYKDIFKLMEIDPARLVYARADRIYAAEEVYLPHFYSARQPHKMGLLPLSAFQNIRKFLAPDSNQPLRRIVYLKRNPPSSRQVINEKNMLHEVSRCLKAGYQLETYAPVNDWRKDRLVLQQARAVIGPHGGAWSNIIFCQQGTDVVEFLPLIRFRDEGKNERPCYYGLACSLGLRYWTLAPKNFYFDKPLAMHVPVEELLAVLQRIGVAE